MLLFIILFCVARYLVDSHWFSAFQKYVTNDGLDQTAARKENLSHPGPVDNSGLFSGIRFEYFLKFVHVQLLIVCGMFCINLK